jgi:hypothetical protein
MYRESNKPLLVKIMGLPKLIGKVLDTRTIYLYRPDSMAKLVLWIPSRRRKGVRDYRLSRERQFQEFLDNLSQRWGVVIANTSENINE